MKTHTLKAQKRDVVGRKVKQLRKTGSIPASVYGKKVKSENIVVSQSEFQAVYKEVGETGLVDLVINGSSKPVLIHHVQVHPVNTLVLHIEFYQVDLKEKVHTKVPLVIVGESKAVSEHKGVLLTLLSEVEVEALPTDLPEKIEVDVAPLAGVDEELNVSDLKVPAGVTILTDSGIAVVKIGALVSKEAQEQAAQEAEAAAEAAQTGEEGKPEDGEKKEEAAANASQEEKKPESKKE